MKLTSQSVIYFVFWSFVIFLTGLLSFNALHYYTFSPHYGILPEKPQYLKDWMWTLSFYVHMGAGVICLFVPVILYMGDRFRLSLRCHRRLGKLYVLDVLMFVVPTGSYLAFFAKGGFVTQLGFLVQGFLLAFCTYLAYREARGGNISAHKKWMVRSYAFSSAVLTFRLLHLLFYQLEIPYVINYALSQWMCLLLNSLIAEVVILGQSNFKFYNFLKSIKK